MKKILILLMLLLSVAANAQQWNVKYYHGSKRGVSSHHECEFMDSLGNSMRFESDQDFLAFNIAVDAVSYDTTEYGSMYVYAMLDMYNADKVLIKTVSVRCYKEYGTDSRFIGNSKEIVQWLMHGGMVKAVIPTNTGVRIIRMHAITQSELNNACSHAII